MDAINLPGIIFLSLIGLTTLIVIIAVLFARRLDRKGIRGSKKMKAENDGNDSVYLS